MKFIKFFLIIIVFVGLTSSNNIGNLDRLSASFISRQVQQGKSVTVKGELFYQNNGNLTSHFILPKEYVLIANKLGESKVYDPSNNTVMLFQNIMYSTQSTQFAYFLSGKKNDMGLSNFGYIQERTFFEGNLFISEWKLKKQDPKSQIQKVKLVLDQQKPIYMDYKDKTGKVIRKVYYYSYQKLMNFDFPSVTTEIIYEGKDSVVSKTIYDNFKLNEEANSKYFNYLIPANAKSIN